VQASLWNWAFSGPIKKSDYAWQGEIRPIIDKTIGNWYFSFNPNLEFALTEGDKSVGISPQFKAMYTINNAVGLGLEYYGFVGTFGNILLAQDQEHLIGPIFDLLTDPDMELNIGFLFGLTDNSNQKILKVIVGRRFGRK